VRQRTKVDDIELDVVVVGLEGSPQWSCELAFNQDSQRHARIKRERIVRDSELLLERPNPDDEQDPDRLTQTHLERVNVNRAFRDLASFFESIRYLHIVPQLVRQPDRSVGRTNDPFGGDFLEQIAKRRIVRVLRGLSESGKRSKWRSPNWPRSSSFAITVERRTCVANTSIGAPKERGRPRSSSLMARCA
jgi:hypothetical protein